MKISILGNIIDTRDIYMITPIVGDRYWDPFRPVDLPSGMSRYIETNRDKSLKHRSFEFDIKLFNDKTIKINLSGDDMFDRHSTWWNEDYLIKIALVERQVNDIRDVIIAYWNKDKSEIPSIEFTFKKE